MSEVEDLEQIRIEDHDKLEWENNSGLEYEYFYSLPNI